MYKRQVLHDLESGCIYQDHTGSGYPHAAGQPDRDCAHDAAYTTAVYDDHQQIQRGVHLGGVGDDLLCQCVLDGVEVVVHGVICGDEPLHRGTQLPWKV